MCIGDRKYCKKRVQQALCDAAMYNTNYLFIARDLATTRAAAWMVMWAGAK